MCGVRAECSCGQTCAKWLVSRKSGTSVEPPRTSVCCTMTPGGSSALHRRLMLCQFILKLYQQIILYEIISARPAQFLFVVKATTLK